MIRLERVWKEYEGGKPALADVSLSVERGEFIFLTGPSGAGKSTLLRLILRVDLPTRGTIEVDGRDITQLRNRDVPALRRQIGFVFQDFKLLPRRTVFENVALVARISGHPEAEQKLRTLRVLKRVGLAHLVDKHPEQISGGEQQRVALARAIVNEPAIVLADEPTGNLDPDLSVGMMELFRQINLRGTTVIVATHDRDLIAKFPRRVLYLAEGGLVSSTGEGRPFAKAVAEAGRRQREERDKATPAPARAGAGARGWSGFSSGADRSDDDGGQSA